jgi:hypothetical protein
MKVILPGQNVPISMDGGPVNPVWYEKLRFLEKLQPLSDIDLSAINTALITKSNVTRTIVTEATTAHAFGPADNGNIVDFTNAAPTNATVPANATIGFPIGAQIDLQQSGAGKVTIVAAGGVTINSIAGNKSLAAQYAGATLIKTAINTWLLIGNIGPP